MRSRIWIVPLVCIVILLLIVLIGFPSQTGVHSGSKERLDVEKLYGYGNVSWNLVIPYDSGHLLERNGSFLFLKDGEEIRPELDTVSEWSEEVDKAHVSYRVCEWRDLRFVFVNVSFGNLTVLTLGIIGGDGCLAMDSFGSKPIVEYRNVTRYCIENTFQLDDKIFKVLIFSNLSANCLVKPLPPPSIATPVPPDIGEFVRAFNERNWSKVYGFYSKRVRANHSLEELKAFEKVRIVDWKILRESLNGATVRFTFKVDETLVNRTYEIPFIYETVKGYEWMIVEGRRFRHGVITFVGYMDVWISPR